jgi:hypothetical protein
MGVDAYVMFARKSDVSRTTVAELLGRSMDDVVWFADQSFAFFTGVRFYQWESGDYEKRIRLTLAHVSPALFDKIEPFALVYPDVANFSPHSTAEAIAHSGASIRVDFGDYHPQDPRLAAAAANETNQTIVSVRAMVAFSEHLNKDDDFRASAHALARVGDLRGLIDSARRAPALRQHVDTLVSAGFFETFIKSSRN